MTHEPFLVRPFAIGDLVGFVPQPAQAADFATTIANPLLCTRMAQNPAWTALRGDRVVAASGVLEYEDCAGVGLGWALFSESITPMDFFRTHRALLARYDAATAHLHRVEIVVDVDFENGRYWADLLGFEIEAELEWRTPDKRNTFLYKRINR